MAILKIEVLFDRSDVFTVFRVGNWLHSHNRETHEHEWEYAPEGRVSRAQAEREFLRLTQDVNNRRLKSAVPCA